MSIAHQFHILYYIFESNINFSNTIQKNDILDKNPFVMFVFKLDYLFNLSKSEVFKKKTRI